MPLAAYGGTGMEDEADLAPEPGATDPTTLPAAAAATMAPAATTAPADAVPVPEDEPARGPNPLARVVHLVAEIDDGCVERDQAHLH